MAQGPETNAGGTRVDASCRFGATSAREGSVWNLSAQASQAGEMGNQTRLVLWGKEQGWPTVPNAGDLRQRTLQVARRMCDRAQDRGREGTSEDQWPEGWQTEDETEIMITSVC